MQKDASSSTSTIDTSSATDIEVWDSISIVDTSCDFQAFRVALSNVLLSHKSDGKDVTFSDIAQEWSEMVSEKLNWTSEKTQHSIEKGNFSIMKAWACCVDTQDIDLMKMICNRIPNNVQINNLLFQFKVQRNSPAMIKVLIEHGFHKKLMIDGVGRTLAHHAAMFDITKTIGKNNNAYENKSSNDWKFVLNHLVSPEYSSGFMTRDASGMLPIDYICQNDDIIMLEYLINEKKMSFCNQEWININLNIDMKLENCSDDIVQCLQHSYKNHCSYSCFQHIS